MQLPHTDLRNACIPRWAYILPPASIRELRPGFSEVLHDLSSSNDSEVLDEIRPGLLLQRDPFEGVLDLVVTLSIFDKPVGDPETTLKILNMRRRGGRQRVRSTCAREDDAKRQCGSEIDLHWYLRF